MRGSSYVHLYHAGAQVDGTAYAGLDGALCYSSGSTLNAPVQEWINDTTRLYRTWINLNDCYPRMDVDELVHIAFAREANGAMKHGWVSLRRVDDQRLWVGAVAIEP